MPAKPKVNKTFAKFSRHVLEEGAFVLDTLRLPIIRDRQQNLVRKTYHVANKVARLGGLSQKKYLRINEKGQVEQI